MTEVSTVALDQIRLNDYNPNSMGTETFNSLLKSMKDGGPEAIDPILIRSLDAADAESAYEVVDGEHRTRAALLLGWPEIGVRVQEMSLEEAMVVNYRKNRERGRLDPIKEGKLYKWWSDERGLTMRQIGEKFDITHATVTTRIRNVENVEEEAIQVLRGQKPSTDDDGKTFYHQSDMTKKGDAIKKPIPRGSSTREEPIEPTKLNLLGSINLEKLLKRARVLTGLQEHIPEDVRLMEELREKYAEKVRSLQVEVADEIREMSFRKAESYVEEVWGALLVEASKERRVRELRDIKENLEKSGKTVILQEEKNWTHRDKLTDRGNVLSKCQTCPHPTVMVTRIGKTEEICGNGACWAETKEEFEAEKRRKAEEARRLLMEAREKIIKAGEEGDHFWFRLLLFALSLNRDTRPGYLEQYNLTNRWKPIVGMTNGQVMGCVLTIVADLLCRPRKENDEVDTLQVLNAISKQYGIDRDYLLWEPEALVDVELEAPP